MAPMIAVGMSAHAQQVPFGVDISLVQSTFKVGQPIILKITYSNTSATEQYVFSRSGGDMGIMTMYKLEVKNSSGKAVADTEHGLDSKGIGLHSPGFSSGLIPVKPGGTIVDTTDLSRLFDLSKVGVYTVQVTRKDDKSAVTAKSGVQQIQITQ